MTHDSVDARQVARWFVAYSGMDDEGVMSNLKLQKLLYYAQGHYLAQTNGTPLFSNRVEAWAHGPVVPDVYHQYKDFGSSPIPADPEFDFGTFSQQLNDFLASIWITFGSRSAWKLREMTHSESPWRNAFAPDERGTEITTDSMFGYFRGLYSGAIPV
ncbi:MAG: DUF4065 domain-containing protein [Candidatus Microbacterium phytovorans]|uniref:DUF4065 domain-containing protein n=1 Tax=Candidatus Microbacterium phytovorans TaxID=3121374 RepID=A0AAJ5W360_9MICO|nr:type II toxin-antitoxin system antitoxin SocA domain-containing protein [Microbacterium sp.]WEK13891.1 MAG: DUF4065 domain-containing protein [Microbacterium sp.]